MPAVKRQVTIEQGATFRFAFTVLDDACEPRDLTGWGARMQVRESAGSDAALLDLDEADQEVTIDHASGKVTIIAPASATASLPAPSVLVYDVIGTAGGGDVERWVEGVVRVSPAVTR